MVLGCGEREAVDRRGRRRGRGRGENEREEGRDESGLTNLAQSLHRFAADLRLLQSPVIGEWSEPFGKRQVGSSAMPFKRNPITAEKIDSLARYITFSNAAAVALIFGLALWLPRRR